MSEVGNALTLLVHASRVSPHLREAVAVVENRLRELEADLDAALRWRSMRADEISLDLAALVTENERLRDALQDIVEQGCYADAGRAEEALSIGATP